MDRPLLAPITYLSFWDVELENLPAGTFTKRVLPKIGRASCRERV